MSDQLFVIELGDQQAVIEPDDAAWLQEKMRREPGSTRLRIRYDDADTEGHAAGSNLRVRVIADDDDTQGHAIAINFPTREDADAFRKRLLVAGVLAGTIALGAAGGIGLANMSNTGSAGAAQSAVTGSDWSQAERPPAAVQSVSGSAWSADERAATTTDASSDATSDTAGEGPSLGGPTPR